jgi:hypothetical protein
MKVVCTNCKKERPAGEEPCPHCSAPAYPHRRTAYEHADWLREEHDRERRDVRADRY